MSIPAAHGKMLLDWEFRAQASPSLVATYYLAMFSAAPDEDGVGAVEFTGDTYARQAITFSAATDLGGGGAEIVNSADIEFPEATASQGTVVAVGVYTALTVGVLKRWMLVTNKAIAAEDQYVVRAGDLHIQYPA